MLSIKMIAGSQAEVNYYAHLGEAENHDVEYYSEDGERSGVWWGPGAAALGLHGAVQPNEFQNLLEGLSPDGKTQLVSKRKGEQIKRRAGFDLTFSMPKSFSIAWAAADPELRAKLDLCAKRAVFEALETVQDLCGVGRRGKDGVEKVEAKLMAAIFSHDTARGVPGEAPDAHRHFHCVIPNVVVREDGTTGALFSRALFRKRCKMALGALMRAELSKELLEIGIETHRPQKERKSEKESWIELTCVPKKLIRAMSKRRLEIERWLRKYGLRGAKSSELAALRTREEKVKYSQSELFEKWRNLAGKFGFSRTVLRAQIAAGHSKTLDIEKEKGDAVRRALKSLKATKARFTEIELLEQTAIESQCQGIGIQEIRSAVNQTIENSSELVRLRDDKGTKTFTTHEMLRIEKGMLAAARRLSFKNSFAASSETVNETLSAYPSLRKEQVNAVRAMTLGSDVCCVQGIAGSGKTYMLGVSRVIWERSGFDVIGTTLAAKASEGLEAGSGIKSIHIHSLLKQIERGEISLSKKSLLVIDESGMVGTRQMAKIFSLVEEAGAKAVLVGDWTQVQPIDSGAAFRGISERIGYTKLDEIIRQREDWAKEVVHDLRDGRAEKALKELYARGQLFFGEDREDAYETLVSDWCEKAIERSELKDTLCFAGTSVEVRELNRRLQAERLSRGELGSESIELDGFDIHVNDRVMVTRNNSPLLLRNGTLATVEAINGSVVTLQLDSNMRVEIDTNEFDYVSLGYCLTTHKGQGVSVENSFIMTGDGMTDRELSYVQGSRAKGYTKFFSDELSGGETISELAAKMNRSRQKELAHEYLLQGE